MSTTTDLESWAAQALCAGAVRRRVGDPDAMFVQGAAQRDARQTCFMCPVRMQCLLDALENGMQFGVWGGLTERERRAMARAATPGPTWRERLAQDHALQERFEQERLRASA